MPEVDTRELAVIPGGPKLARTPVAGVASRDNSPSLRELPPSPELNDHAASSAHQVRSLRLSSPCSSAGPWQDTGRGQGHIA